jgi:hypothetical protein
MALLSCIKEVLEILDQSPIKGSLVALKIPFHCIRCMCRAM